MCAKLRAALPTRAPDDAQALIDLREGCSNGHPNIAEGFDLDNAGQQQIQAIKFLGNVPLAVLVRAPAHMDFMHEWVDIPQNIIPKLDQVWQDVQREYTALSSDSQLIIADHVGDRIQKEPELVTNQWC